MHLHSKTFFPSSSFFLPRIYIYSGYNYFSRDPVFRTLFLWLLASRYTWICQGHSKNGIWGGHKQNPLDLLWMPTPVSLSVPLSDLSIQSTFPPELWTFISCLARPPHKYRLKFQNPGDNMVQENWVLIFLLFPGPRTNPGNQQTINNYDRSTNSFV